MFKTGETILEIDLEALAHNYHHLRSRAAANVKFMAVVKAYAYGNEASTLAKKLSSLGVDYFAVAYTDEGVALREKGIEEPILVLHPQSANFERIIDHCLEPSIYSRFVLNEFVKTATGKAQTDYPVHLKLNTGLNRLGFAEDDMEFLLDTLQQTNTIKLKGIFSHLAASEDWREREFTLKQLDRFRKMTYHLVETIKYKPLLHLCNTSGIINYPEAHFDMVRSGIGLYGFGNDPELDKQLKPIGTLKTLISQIHHLDKGETVGYNRAFKAKEKIKMATLPLGHADGINRQYGNEKAGVWVNGNYAPIIGNVCMDMLMINITGIDCEEGDEVIIFGEPQHATDFAKKGNTISYELITGISQRVKRKFINEN
ncbi:alanine racemase [Antarcticibacterium flavum]|uniref:Alanine racemase n=1 Tax=Antarcticibacterium flavum TaxID=2058175 RepID=A0A5B7X321_9FLAO|nr:MULTISPECIES: alanine racemase [Antarcticibacterium]MCM4160137.1 alanine racemase [Antarcticibacterium sp. W02-3]QCY69690.1 alanine racemase [Antarcticibacterium flavum]